MSEVISSKLRRIAAEPARIVPFPGRTPERLVGVGFRCWLSGFETGDISSWEDAWNTYLEATNRDAAKLLLLRLSGFVRAVKSSAERDIEFYPRECRGFCRDECLAISVIAASQHDQRREMCVCAAALTGCQDIGGTIAAAQDFAAELRCADQVLSPSSICAANCPLFTARRKLQ